MPYDGTPGAGSLYRTDPDGTVERVLDGLTIVNGPVFNSDGTALYLADSAAGTIHRWRVDPATGDLTGHEIFARFSGDEGSPDGMTVDDEDCLWVAVWGGGAVRRYRPDGRLLRTLTVPAPQPTSVCLHPSEPRLLITTARHGLRRPTAASGAVISVHVPARAPEARSWGGSFGGAAAR
ncbi:SMP-30/gluconolactonase/LRE family protein [Streptomyces sp. AC555_RSS877]|uniref:SMP-30/gluconolactonase/LRE family protein n=1 Tax=Streptomyces sp. AC555_RSS877 TaxID=2823688 RepID=UPI0027E55ED4|nr:SMP-30/gluconolactonase/LRE family protein [Streptomyces sp. AC555_RSS877]